MSKVKEIQKNWMAKKKITIRSIEDGKPVTKQISVDGFVDLYNTQNVVLTKTTHLVETILALLYKESPNNQFFKKYPDLEEFAKKRSETIEKEVSLKIDAKE